MFATAHPVAVLVSASVGLAAATVVITGGPASAHERQSYTQAPT